MRKIRILLGSTGLLLAMTAMVVAQQHTMQKKTAKLQEVGSYRVQTTAMAKGLVLRFQNVQGKHIPATGGSGMAMLRIGASKKEHKLQLVPLKSGDLGVAVDLSKLVARRLHLNVTVDGVGEKQLKFKTIAQHGGLDDAMLVSLQKTCPVTGKPLGSMGTPPKVYIGEKPLFVCCAGCTSRLEKNSEQYLQAYYQTAGKEVRPGVVEATLADAVAIAVQKKCPVMDEPLGGMGVPQKVNVKGKAVFICCAGCAKKLAAEPDQYLAALKNQGVTPPEYK